MTKLGDIIDAATTDAVSVPTLLRMVQVVASRLGTVTLESWVNYELTGYPDSEDVPPYRGPFDAEVVGRLAGPHGSEFDLPLPFTVLPPDMREGWAFKMIFQQPMSELEGLARGGKALQNPWRAAFVGEINRRVEAGEMRELIPYHGLIRAWKPISPQQMTAVVDAVRTRVLTLALELEKLYPEAGESRTVPGNIGAVETMIVNVIHGDGNNLAVASPSASLSSGIAPGDLAGLLAAVSAFGLPQDEVDELAAAIEADGAGATEPGPGVQRFLGRLALGTGSVAGKVGISAAGGTVAALVRAFFGLP